MITLPSEEELQDLEMPQDMLCTTIYVPYLTSNGATNPMRIALKDLLKVAGQALRSAGASDDAIRRALAPGKRLAVSVREFWPHRHEGIALLMNPQLFRHYRLPENATPFSIYVGHSFDVEPLRRLRQEDRQYALLVLDHQATQLYIGDRYHLTPAPIDDFPADMKRTLRIDEYPSWRELHEVAPAYIGKGSEGYHSQYNVAEVDKVMLTEFFRIIDRRIHAYMVGLGAPLILAGVGYLLPLYRSINTYTGLSAVELHGNFRRVPPDRLRAKTLRLLASAA